MKEQLLWLQNGAICHIEKENAELEAQIEKMKCCNGCKHIYAGLKDTDLHCAKNEDYVIGNPYTEKCDKWELEK